MAFDNVGSILQTGSLSSSMKLLLIAASSSRPKYRSLCLGLLRPFTKNGEVLLRYRCYSRDLQCFVRIDDLKSDLLSVLELGVRDTYNLDLSFEPDLVIDGGGNIGPNLTDAYWIHGSKPIDIFHTVIDGVPAKGMPTWGPQLGDDRIESVVAYVLSIRDTNVPAGKAPQGDRVEAL